MTLPPSANRLIASCSRPLARSLWLVPRAKRRDVSAVLAQLLWMERELGRLHALGGSELRHQVMAVSARLSGVKSLAAEPPSLLHPAWDEAAARRALSGMQLLEYLDGLNIALVQHRFRDAVSADQYAHKLGAGAARLLAASLGLPAKDLAAPLDALGRWWVHSRLLLFWLPMVYQGRIPFPLDELEGAGLGEADILPDHDHYGEEPGRLQVYRQEKAGRLPGLLRAAWPVIEEARRHGAGPWVESLLAWRAAQIAEFRRKGVLSPSQPPLIRTWLRREALLASARA